MFWFPFTLLCALSLSTADALTKYFFSRFEVHEIVLVRLIGSAPFLLIPLFFIKWPSLSADFWITLFMLFPLEILAFFLYMEAIKVSPLSLTIPFLAFTPMFMIVTGWVVLGEKLTVLGILGIFLVVCGAYVLYFDTKKDIFAPFRAMFREKGTLLMLVVSFIYSVTSVLGKRCILLSSPDFFAFFYYPFVAFVTVILVFVRYKMNVRWKALLSFGSFSVGFFQAVSIVFHVLAIARIEAAYMIAVKRSSLLFSVIYGRLLFREEKFAMRIVGASIMFAGCVILYFQS